jgi:hypothetical protein
MHLQERSLYLFPASNHRASIFWYGNIAIRSSMTMKESLFALSLFPYLGFLWYLHRSQQSPKLASIGFYLTLVFVAVTIPAGIYAQNLGKSLADVDWLHGGAEFFLTLSNICIVLGFTQAISTIDRTE